jgi:hypothetical protein
MRPSEQLRFWAHELAAMAQTGSQLPENLSPLRRTMILDARASTPDSAALYQ